MYAWIWRRLPFGLPGKLAGSVVIVAALIGLLWYVVFPWAEPLLPFDDVQVTQDSDGVENGPPGAPGLGPNDDPGDYEIPYNTTQQNTPPPTNTPSR